VWSRRLRLLAVSVFLLGAGAPAPQDPPPALGGIRLGSVAREVRRVLGAPERMQESIGMRFWDYERRGIALIWQEGEAGVLGIVATRAAAGAIRDVRVGDPEAVLRKAWGEPARIRQEGRFLDYVGDGWVFSVELRDGAVVEMTLMGTRAAR
jgi:hypothetical protein